MHCINTITILIKTGAKCIQNDRDSYKGRNVNLLLND